MPIITLLLAVSLSLAVTKIAASVLTYTGISRDMAKFQARSAFTGCGFTTTEAEQIVGHPVRRRVIMILMIGGNAGLVTVIASMVPTLSGSGAEAGEQFLVIAGGLAALWMVAQSKTLDDLIFRFTGYALRKWTSVDIHDYVSMLQFYEGYSVTELKVDGDHWLTGKCLIDLNLKNEGIQVIGIHRANKEFVPTPLGTTFIRQGDRLIMYGRTDQIADLQTRRADYKGEREHKKYVEEQTVIVEQLKESERGPRDEPES